MRPKPRILAVEDSIELRIALELSLLQQGYEVKVTDDGASFLAVFDEFQPDLALIDLRLPGISGLDVLVKLREKSRIPAIVFSAVEETAEVKEVIAHGATDYVLKGTGIDELLRRISRYLKAGQEEVADAPVGQARDSKLRDSGSASFSSQAHVLLCVPDSPVLSQLLVMIKRQGRTPILATSKTEALLTSGDRLIDFIILGPEQPERFGIRLVEQISQMPRSTKPGVIFLSERIRPEIRRRLRQCIIMDYLPHSIRKKEMEFRLRSAFERYGAQSKAAS